MTCRRSHSHLNPADPEKEWKEVILGAPGTSGPCLVEEPGTSTGGVLSLRRAVVTNMRIPGIGLLVAVSARAREWRCLVAPHPLA